MAISQRQQRKADSKNSSPNLIKAKSASSNSNIWILAIAFAALMFYVLYQSISIYNQDRMYNDFD